MEQIIAKIDGMMCGMCESHMNDMVRNNFKVKKVTSSHAKKETVIVAEEGFDDAKFTEEVEKLGYKVLGIEHQPYEKKGLFLSLIHISEPTRRTPISYAVFCLKKKKITHLSLINIRR